MQTGAAYWLARIAADEARARKTAKAANKYLRRIYQREYNLTVDNLEQLYKRVTEKGETLSRTALWNYNHWKNLEKQLRSFATKTPVIAIGKINAVLDDAFLIGIGQPIGGFGGVEKNIMLSSWNARAVINSEWSGASFSDRVWNNTQAVAARIRTDMENAMIQGKGIGTMKKTLMKDFGVAYNDAARLVDTEVSYVFNQGTILRLKNDGYERVMWSTGKTDGAECQGCLEKNGLVYDINNRPTMPLHPRCRCRWVPVARDKDKAKPTTDPMLVPLPTATKP